MSGIESFGSQPSRSFDDMDILTAEPQRLEAAPHVDVDRASLNFWAGIHDCVDAVVFRHVEIRLNDRSDRQQIVVGGRHAARTPTPDAVVWPLQYAVAWNFSRVPGAGFNSPSSSAAWRAA